MNEQLLSFASDTGHCSGLIIFFCILNTSNTIFGMECPVCNQPNKHFKCSSCCTLFINLKQTEQDALTAEVEELKSKVLPLTKKASVSYTRLIEIYTHKRDYLRKNRALLDVVSNIPKEEESRSPINLSKPPEMQSNLIESRRRLVKDLISIFRLRKSKSSLEYRIHNSTLSLSSPFPRDRFNASLAFTAQLTHLLAAYTDTILPFEINTKLVRPTITLKSSYYLYLGQELSESFYIALTALCFNVAYIAHCNGVAIKDESECCLVLDLIAKTCTSPALATGSFGGFEIDFDVLYAAVSAALNGETDIASVVERAKSGEDQWEKL